MHSPECIKRLENTFLKKYGATNPWGNKEIWLNVLKHKIKIKKEHYIQRKKIEFMNIYVHCMEKKMY